MCVLLEGVGGWSGGDSVQVLTVGGTSSTLCDFIINGIDLGWYFIAQDSVWFLHHRAATGKTAT